MLESLNDYVSFITLLALVLFFIYLVLSLWFKSIERSRIKKAMIKREQEQKGEL